MDWDSIKRNFRFRSGRANRFEKRYPSHPPTRAYEPSSTSPSHPTAPHQQSIQSGTQPVSNPSKTASGASGSNTKPKLAGPPTSKPTTKPSQPQRPQTQAVGMQLANGTAAQPKKAKLNRQRGDRIPTNAALCAQGTEDTDDFDLKPQPRKKKSTSLDVLSESLFSGGHLNTILHDPQLFARFTTFLNRYRPQVSPILVRYLETQKAIKAVEYANAVAQSVTPLPSDGGLKKDLSAAHVDSSFGEMREKAFDQLLADALPAYITYSLIKVVTEIMVNEITGRSTPIMKGLVSGLSEVFCLTDPNQEDNPIIYASEEFYHMTGYSRDFVIGTNCRFLQGPKTKRHSVQRFRQAVDSGQELSEALLNYRRDGRPFMNILMIAPLHDNKGNVKYHIGAQVDASGLIEGGKGLDGFEKYLALERAKPDPRGRSSARESIPAKGRLSTKEAKKMALEKLGELSEMFDLEENAIVVQRSRSNSRERGSEDEESLGSGRSRRVFAESTESESEEEGSGETERAAWTLSQTGRSGKLPGVYQSYFLMRPSPSLKIIFASPALRKMGNLIQSTLLSHIAAPPATLKGLKESFESGNPVTAKVLFSAQASESKDGRELDRSQSKRDIEEASSSKLGRTCWISATPLLGGDDEVGVWMVVLVDQRSLSSGSSLMSSTKNSQQKPPRKVNGDQQTDSPSTPLPNSMSASTSRATKPSHIDIPDRIGVRQEDIWPETDANPLSPGSGSPQPRMPSATPQRAKKGQQNIIGEHEWLRRNQHPGSSSLASPGQHADEFVRKHETRDMSAKSNRVNIQPDTEDEDDDFMLANEPGTDNGVPPKLASEPDETVLMHNGSVLGAEAGTGLQKESNGLQRTEPEKNSHRVEDRATSSRIRDPAPKQAPDSTSNAEVETTPPPAPEPLSEQALETHNKEMLAKERPIASVHEAQIEATKEQNMSPVNSLKEDPEAEPDPPVLIDAGPDEGYFGPATIEYDQESEHNDNGDDAFASIVQNDSINAVLEFSHSTSKPANSRTASGYMDYIRHPGSRPDSRRAITGTNLGTQAHAVDELDQKQWPRHEDPDCDMRTPFSVD